MLICSADWEIRLFVSSVVEYFVSCVSVYWFAAACAASAFFWASTAAACLAAASAAAAFAWASAAAAFSAAAWAASAFAWASAAAFVSASAAACLALSASAAAAAASVAALSATACALAASVFALSAVCWACVAAAWRVSSDFSTLAVVAYVLETSAVICSADWEIRLFVSSVVEYSVSLPSVYALPSFSALFMAASPLATVRYFLDTSSSMLPAIALIATFVSSLVR